MHRFAVGMLLCAVLLSSGCSMCQSCFDDAYPMYGGIAPRTDRYCGRVGSRFAPGGPDVGTVSPYQRETEKGQLYSEGPTSPQVQPTPELNLPPEV